jgi:hypothetical protein
VSAEGFDVYRREYWSIQTVVRTALDDIHKNQAVAQKILMDRILPISTFDKQ